MSYVSAIFALFCLFFAVTGSVYATEFINAKAMSIPALDASQNGTPVMLSLDDYPKCRMLAQSTVLKSEVMTLVPDKISCENKEDFSVKEMLEVIDYDTRKYAIGDSFSFPVKEGELFEKLADTQ